jgi:hypothetical protein
MLEFILHAQLFHLVAEGYDLWSDIRGGATGWDRWAMAHPKILEKASFITVASLQCFTAISSLCVNKYVTFVWCDIPKPIQWWQAPLHIVLVESMSKPPKCIRYCFHHSIFAYFFLARKGKYSVL